MPLTKLNPYHLINDLQWPSNRFISTTTLANYFPITARLIFLKLSFIISLTCFKSLPWLPIAKWIKFKHFSLTFKALTPGPGLSGQIYLPQLSHINLPFRQTVAQIHLAY